MYIHLTDTYRRIGSSLYRRTGDAFTHCATIPPTVGPDLGAAVRWYESTQQENQT